MLLLISKKSTQPKSIVLKKIDLPLKIAPFVKEMVFLESSSPSAKHKIPFYADGFAGIVFSKSQQPFVIQPQNKVLPDFYLYGQTLMPMTLETEGTFQLYALRLFPFAVPALLGLEAHTLNDDCYDLLQVENIDTQSTLSALRKANTESDILNSFLDYFALLLKNAATNPSRRMILAVNMILKSNGNISITDLRNSLHITERTLERLFKKEMGVTAIQFAKIIQFHTSMKILKEEEYINLTEIGFKSGYADQSHFIRSFKKYTGKTPKEFRKFLSL